MDSNQAGHQEGKSTILPVRHPSNLVARMYIDKLKEKKIMLSLSFFICFCFVTFLFSYNINWNYGLLPQTWEDPAFANSEVEGAFGDNDPGIDLFSCLGLRYCSNLKERFADYNSNLFTIS